MRYKIYWLLKCQFLYCMFSSWNLVFGQIRYLIPEELQLGAFVGNIAEDLSLDIKQLSARNLRIVTGPKKQCVDINLDTGILIVTKTIDREEICGQSLSCALNFDVFLENPLKLYQVTVEILDVNDNAPGFPNTPFRLEISERSLPGTRFQLEPAHDLDVGANSVQTYELLPNDYFILDVQMRGGKEKSPVLVLQRPLDRETESSCRLTLIAKDGGVPVRSGTAQITIVVNDANDNAPVFPQSVYRVSLLENAAKGTHVIILNATDLDSGVNGEINYSFGRYTSARVREMFALNSRTGEISVKGKLDYEENDAFGINIQATDGGPDAMSGHCEVLVNIIDVNDNPPEVTLTSSSSIISEDAPVETVVALFTAADKDSGTNGQIECQISNNLPFNLDSSLKNYYGLLVHRPLDRENTAKYDVAITCTDFGNPPLSSQKTIRVEVSDINDNAPHFRQSLFTTNVLENNAVGASIFSITAFDADSGVNARLKYSILETQIHNESVFNYIFINSDTGVIFAQRSFDYEELKNFQIQAQVMDSGTPSLANNVSVDVIILDQNDNAPVIVQPIVEFGSTAVETISRFAEPGYLVAKVSATDADAGQNAYLSYSIFQATQHNLFTISPDSGEIWIIRHIVTRDASKQRLVILVKDNGSPSLSASVTIILSVVGGDAETFSSVSSSSENPRFIPDLSLSLVIALGTISSIFLVILIVLAMKIHKSRNPLGAQHCSLGVCCCLQTRQSLNGIQKASRNVQIPPNYVEVFGGDPLSQSFRYESCSTLQSTRRDYIMPNTYRSSTDKKYAQNDCIGKQDPELLHTEKIRNHLNNEIRYLIPEELQLGAFVGNIAEDLSLDIKQFSARNLRIVTGPKKQYVDINLDTGILIVTKTIDREEICGQSLSCALSLDVFLENPLKLNQVTVEILDVNDNAPSFPNTQFRLEISERSIPGARFPLEPAHDLDVGANSVQTYELLPNDYFILDVQMRGGKVKSPVLVLQRSLDRETESSCRLTLTAKDGGVPVRSGTAQITIVVNDTNDNAPVFPQSVYRVSLLENAAKGTHVIILNATDLDSGVNGEITYSFGRYTSARVREMFALNSRTGEISVKGKLDYEENDAFEINIQATDGGPDVMSGHCEVLVNIIDVNDNPPEVTLTSLSSIISEDAPVETVVALFTAADKDSGTNGQVECQISNKLPFKLDSSLKKYYGILVHRPLDRENTAKYDVAITCTDFGNPPLSSQKTIRVEISDINDNAPHFRQSLLTTNVLENNAVGASIFSITAFDADSGVNARLKYSILETQIHNESVFNYISINSDTGVIFAQRSFDYEELKNFQIQAQVMDSGTPSLANNVSVDVIILDQNDNAPVIVQPLVEFGSTAVETISRFAEPGYLVAKVSATDADAGQNARLSYSIFQATQHNLFTISPDSGEIWIIRRIVTRDASKQRLVILVKDNGSPSLSASVAIILSVIGGDAETFSSVSSSSENPRFIPDLSLSLVIALGTISSIFLVILIVLAVKIHKSRNPLGAQHCSLGVCCCLQTRQSLNGIQKASRNVQIPPNYVEVFGGDPLSQSFRYESCSTLQSTRRDYITPTTYRSSTDKKYAQNDCIGKQDPELLHTEKIRNHLNNEVSHFENGNKILAALICFCVSSNVGIIVWQTLLYSSGCPEKTSFHGASSTGVFQVALMHSFSI
ncbi:cadherin-23-like [Hemiscyllium ocellatum]|uniref:cadherin-23-like n=1 Tax=Hemiscyllium ocellatum TaxID=170820 RepID=UPI002966966E|nr:cadherin-23-like [Hemiscyllium ocellatum]